MPAQDWAGAGGERGAEPGEADMGVSVDIELYTSLPAIFRRLTRPENRGQTKGRRLFLEAARSRHGVYRGHDEVREEDHDQDDGAVDDYKWRRAYEYLC